MYHWIFQIVLVLLLIFGKLVIRPNWLPEVVAIQIGVFHRLLNMQRNSLDILLVCDLTPVDDVAHDIRI